MNDIYTGTPRKPLTSKQKLQLFLKKGGVCCLCGQKIASVNEAWDEHLVPLIDGGGNETTNRDIAHDKCARRKTAAEASSRAKLRRAAERHHGARTPKTRPMPGGRKSPWKKTMSGEWVRRHPGRDDPDEAP